MNQGTRVKYVAILMVLIGIVVCGMCCACWHVYVEGLTKGEPAQPGPQVLPPTVLPPGGGPVPGAAPVPGATPPAKSGDGCSDGNHGAGPGAAPPTTPRAPAAPAAPPSDPGGAGSGSGAGSGI